MRNTILLTVLLLVIGCTQQPSMPMNMDPGQMNHMMHQEGFLPGESLDINNLKKVKSSTIIDVKDGDTVELSADIIVKEIKGKEYKMYGYNGMIPGPVFRAKKNSRITVNFHNNIDWETTVHWHGLRHDNKDDGVPGVTQESVKPGETFTYTVFFPDEGLYWYHPHVREDLQQDNGLAGNMLVNPLADDYYNPVNREEFLFLDDILIENNEIVPFGKDHANFAIMGRFGNTLLANGETNYELKINKGDVVRFYITNVANVRPFNISFGGVKMKLVGSDLGKYEEEEFVNSVTISPAERYIVEVYFPGDIYRLRNLNHHKEYYFGTIETSGKSETDYSDVFNSIRTNEEIVEDIDQYRKYFDKEFDYELELTVDMPMGYMNDLMSMMDMDDMNNMPCHMMPDGSLMGDCRGIHPEQERMEWEDSMKMMNSMSTSEHVTWIIRDKETGKENMDIEMNTKIGDIIKIKLFNNPKSMHPMQHPFHIHGQRFLVLSEDDIPNENLVWKDTVLVPIGRTVDILLEITNPGEWMMHCHIAEHLESGMMSSFTVE